MDQFSPKINKEQREFLISSLGLERFEQFDNLCIKKCFSNYTSSMDTKEKACLDTCTRKVLNMMSIMDSIN